MTTLAIAVDADDELWTLDALPTPEAPYVEVGDELVEVRSRFPSQIYSLTGQALPPRIRVRRGIAGTTAASHLSGVTLTPNYGLGGGAGGAGVTVDNLSDPPAEVTSIVAAGATIVGDEATLRGKDFYAQDTDPGAVGQGSVWKDTSTDLWWTRNPANTAWLPRIQVIVQSSGTVANATLEAIATAAGAANATLAATSVDDGANANASANASGDGSASAGAQASTAGAGVADAGPVATASGAGDATVLSQAVANTGAAKAGALATRDAVTAGIYSKVDELGVAKLGFNAVAAVEGIPIPVIPAVPTEQDIADVLVALGLATQAS